jgi:hypothetical protein
MNEKKQTGKVNYVWLLAGGYLLYLAYNIFKAVFTGDSSYPVLGLLGGSVFVAAAVFLFVREWKAYQFAVEHKDDPSTWSDDPETLDNEETLDEPEEPDDDEELDDDELDDIGETEEEEEP